MSYLDVPLTVATCPYCKSGLCVEPMGWDVETNLITDATVWCIADLEAFDDWLAEDKETDYDENSHPCGYDPDWMQASMRAEAWVQTQQRERDDPAPASGAREEG